MKTRETYFLFFAVAFLLIVGNQAFVYTTLSTTKYDAEIINTASRQKMLVQRIKFALIDHYLSKDECDASFKEFQDAHIILESKVNKSVFFVPEEGQLLVDSITPLFNTLQGTMAVLDPTDEMKFQQQVILDEMLMHYDDLVVLMEGVHRQRVWWVRLLLAVFTTVILVFLVYEVYWVFLPTLKGLEYSKLTLQRKSQDLKSIQKAFKNTSKGLETPIGTMSAHVQALEDGCENPAGLKDLDKMKSAVQGLTGIVTTINSELSLEGNLEKEQLSIGSLVEDVRRDLSHMIKENKAVIIDRSEHSLYVNRTEWKLLLQNLVSNAIKYRRDDIDPIVGIQSFTRRNELCVSVSDNGMGIPAKDLPRVFDYEFRAMNSKARKGFGYGLSHCQSIVDRYNGKITVDSKVNFGSTFTISIPMS